MDAVASDVASPEAPEDDVVLRCRLDDAQSFAAVLSAVAVRWERILQLCTNGALTQRSNPRTAE